ncbi:MAG TPA: hypothetical protein VKA34_19135 [Balneolales bacterium]|nr:hypothetical protein [Balneolales bacterium]
MKPIKKTPHPSLRLYQLSFIELWRNRFGLLLLIVIPIVFIAIVEWTSGTNKIPIDLYRYHETKQIILSQHDVNLVFIGAAVSGFLTAYYAILLFHRNFEYFRHCIGMGLSPIGFVNARFLFFLTVTTILAALISLILCYLVKIEQPFSIFIGFIFVGIIYGAFGGAVGLLSKDIMVAILLVVLMANLDAGWLQNPVFYTSAQDTGFIHWLPAFYPTQTIFAAAFTKKLNSWSVLLSSIYSIGLLVIMLLIVHLKLRKVKKWWET